MSNNNSPQSQQQQGQNPPPHQNNKLLIFNPSPRLIRVFESKVKLLNSKYDIFRVKYDFDERHAYYQGRDYFLNDPQGKKYTHMAILPDDLLIETHQVDKLMSELERKPDMDVLSGVCNWSMINQKFYNTVAVIPFDRRGAYPLFKTQAKYQYISLLQREQYKAETKGVKRVLFAAFSFTIISRKVLEQFGFEPIQPSGQVVDGMGKDTIFYNNCYRKGIQCYADYDTMLLHIKDIERNNDITSVIRYADENNIKTGLVMNPNFKQENVLLKAGSMI